MIMNTDIKLENVPLAPTNYKVDFSKLQPVEIGKKKLGSGAYASVKLVKDVQSGKLFALKEIELSRVTKTDLLNIEREIGFHQKIDHPNIIHFYDYLKKDEEKKVLILLEYAENGDLFNYLNKKGAMNETNACKYFVQTALALNYIHSFSMLHRDVKPENILLDGQLNAKVCDFGWSAEYDDNTRRQTVCGTYEYMAPEVIFKKQQDTGIDIWALGVLLYELFYNKAPFPGRSLTEVGKKIAAGKPEFDKKVPEDARDLIEQILKMNPKQRPTIPQLLNHPFVLRCYGRIDESQYTFNKQEQAKSATVVAHQTPMGRTSNPGSHPASGRTSNHMPPNPGPNGYQNKIPVIVPSVHQPQHTNNYLTYQGAGYQASTSIQAPLQHPQGLKRENSQGILQNPLNRQNTLPTSTSANPPHRTQQGSSSREPAPRGLYQHANLQVKASTEGLPHSSFPKQFTSTPTSLHQVGTDMQPSGPLATQLKMQRVISKYSKPYSGSSVSKPLLSFDNNFKRQQSEAQNREESIPRKQGPNVVVAPAAPSHLNNFVQPANFQRVSNGSQIQNGTRMSNNENQHQPESVHHNTKNNVSMPQNLRLKKLVGEFMRSPTLEQEKNDSRSYALPASQSRPALHDRTNIHVAPQISSVRSFSKQLSMDLNDHSSSPVYPSSLPSKPANTSAQQPPHPNGSYRCLLGNTSFNHQTTATPASANLYNHSHQQQGASRSNSQQRLAVDNNTSYTVDSSRQYFIQHAYGNE